MGEGMNAQDQKKMIRTTNLMALTASASQQVNELCKATLLRFFLFVIHIFSVGHLLTSVLAIWASGITGILQRGWRHCV